jgi:acyl carrier protein
MTQALRDSGATSAEIMDVIHKKGRIDFARLAPEATLESLGLASIDLVMALLTIEEKYGVNTFLDNELSQAKNLGEFVESVACGVQTERAKGAGGLWRHRPVECALIEAVTEMPRPISHIAHR